MNIKEITDFNKDISKFFKLYNKYVTKKFGELSSNDKISLKVAVSMNARTCAGVGLIRDGTRPPTA